MPSATCPLAPLSDLLPLAVALWGSFARPFVVLPPSWTPFLGRAFLALCLVFGLFLGSSLVLAPLFRFSLFVFRPVVLRLSSLRPLCASSGVAGFPFFVVMWLPSPAGCCLPAPHRLFPCGVLVQLLCWSLPLGIWLLHATARLPCPNAWGVVVLCFLASFCFMAAKAFGPVWGLCYPLHHGAFVVVVLCAPALRYSSSDDPGPPLDTAKLHTRHSLLHVWHTLLLSFSAFPAPSLPPFCLVVCV